MRVSAGEAKGALICGAVTLGLLVAGCTSGAKPQAAATPAGSGSPSASSSPATSPTSSSASSPAADCNNTLTIDIAIADGKTTPEP